MTLKEAKKILKKEGFLLSLASKVINQTGAIREFEKPEVCEAIKVANANKWTIGLSPIEWNEREKRLKKEHEKNNKESAHDKKSMTLEEAKDMLMKEGFKLEGPGKPCDVSECFIELESPEICEAMQIVSSAGYMIMMEVCDFNARKARLKEQLEEHSNAPTSSSPALKEAASQFNDALLDEQADKIKRLGKEITRLNKVIHKKNMKIEEFRKESSIQLRGKIKMFVENVDLKKSLRKTESLLHDTREANSRNLDTCFKNEDLIDELKKKLAEKTKLAKKYAKELSDSSLGLCKLEKQLKDKNAVLSVVAEDLRLTKIREKNLAELGLKYVGENEKLKKKLADKIVDKIDAQALKSAESALAYKENVIAEKDEVIADLGKELAATKKELKAKKALVDHISKIRDSAKINLNLREKECENLKEALEEKTKLVEMVRNASKEYCDYGVAANEFIKELASLYVIANNKGIINDEMLERCKSYQTYGFPANCNRETKKEINDIARGNESKKPSLFRDDSVGAVTNQKDCSPVKDTHPTEDNPDEVNMNEILEHVRKILEEGGTVYTSYDKAEEGGDQSATIVQHRKSIVDLFKEIKRLWQE